MKKLLVSTTALVSIMASSAFADIDKKLDVKLNGNVNIEYGARSQKAGYRSQSLTKNQKNSGFNNGARVSVSATAKADAGYTYGAVAGLMVSGPQKTGKDSSTTDNTYIFLESSLGRVEIGSNYSASKTMGISGGTVARATGGATGDWDNFFGWDYDDAQGNTYSITENANNNNITKTNKIFYTSTSLIGDAYGSATTSEQTNKFTYYTPKISGFQLGLSYTPDSDRNANGSFSDENPGRRTLKNLLNAGLTYSNTFDQITLGLSAIGSTGKAPKKNKNSAINHNYQGYAFGGSLAYSAFSVSGNWGTMSKKFFTYDNRLNSGELGDANITKAPKFWSASVAYVQGPFGISASYYNSKSQNKNKFNAWSVGADYSLAPGITSYAEFTQANAKINPSLKSAGNAAPSVKNKGNVFIVGTTLSF